MGPDVHILLVDDRPDEFLSAQAILADSPYTLVSASSGAEALKCLLKNDFALIIMDVLMPDMDGFETARRIKTRKKIAGYPDYFPHFANVRAGQLYAGLFVGRDRLHDQTRPS
ncbi:response regulator [Cohnella rhizosphaerae]|uniref:Response regulator n=1 Tax=Cohnella rhizosphaerae TaxID=1457232 RepID=A0A9X4QU94_9BACL|nr:response regulator [Cohnella rhizosphaerae]MDG0811480.1 response regulator [Cohnella rhizosphaerae]